MLWKEKEGFSETVRIISEKLEISPFLASLLAKRGIHSPEKAYYFLYGDIKNSVSPFVFKDMQKTVEYLKKVIENKEPLYIVGDKDVDGLTGTAIYYLFFQKMGLSEIYYNFPQEKESYGFSDRIFKDILSVKNLKTVITVDCGIKENHFTKLLKEHKISTIITDHHTLGEELPEAYSIINPHLEAYSMEYLSGAAVALKVIEGIYFSYHKAFYNKKMLFLEENQTKWMGVRAENFVPEEKILIFHSFEELENFIQKNNELIVVSFGILAEKLKKKVLKKEIQIINILELSSKKMNINVKNLKSLADFLKVYYDEKKIHKTLFSLMKKIFLKYFLQIEEKLEAFFQFATLGTICDYMPLNTIENHILVKDGLDLFNKNLPEYVKVIKPLKNEELNIRHVGYEIGPVLNSGGRLGQPQIAFNLLIEKDNEKLNVSFEQLDTLNTKRKKIGDTGYQKAMQEIENHQKEETILFYSSSEIVQGVTGIIATKISKLYKKPSFVFFIEEEMGEIVGSGRSFNNFDILNILEGCKCIFTRFGGHKNACGMSFPLKHLDEVTGTIRETSKKYMDKSLLEDIFLYDLEIQVGQVNFNLLNEIKKLYPYGPFNEEPVFYSKNLTPIDARTIGKDDKHLKFKVKENPNMDFIGWNMAGDFQKIKHSKIDVLYNLTENVFNKNSYLQAIILDLIEI